jgi:hypothetical protein
VAQRQGFADDDVAIPVVPVVVQIRAAKTGGADRDLEICWARWREEAMFLAML